MKNIGLRRLAGAWLLLPAIACAQQQAGGGWWDATKAGDGLPQAVAQQQPAAADAVQVPEAVEQAGHSLDSPSAASPLVPDAATLAAFDCVEVKRFDVVTGFIGSKEDARAATIPVTQLEKIQRSVAGHVPEKAVGLKSTLVGEGWPQCPDPARALVLGGRITDYKEGNQALRYLVGFGAGAQKFSVEVWLTRKADDALLARGDVVDRKVGGWVGGQSEKGLDDFAEKVAGFVRDSLKGPKPVR